MSCALRRDQAGLPRFQQKGSVTMLGQITVSEISHDMLCTRVFD